MEQIFNPEFVTKLKKNGEVNNQQYNVALPFPHIIIDDFLPIEVIKGIVENYPSPSELEWNTFNEKRQKKLAFSDIENLSDNIREIFYFLNSAIILQFLENLTGIEGLIPDPYFTGGGLHQIERGGLLKVHADFNKYEKLNLDRRLNLLLYLNEDWKDEYGGHLELWDKPMASCVKKISPIFNRCVIFSTTDFSYHGHPEPLNCPPNRTRRSLATYYYTNGRPKQEESQPHSTIFQARPGESINKPFSLAQKLKSNFSGAIPQKIKTPLKESINSITKKFGENNK